MLKLYCFGIVLVCICLNVNNAQSSSSSSSGGGGVPIGVIIDENLSLGANSLKKVISTAISYINNGITYGRNKWSVHMSVLKTQDSNELIRATCEQMSKGVLAIFAQTNSPGSRSAIQSLVNLYKIPFVTMSHPAYRNYKNLDPYNYECRHEMTSLLEPEERDALASISSSDSETPNSAKKMTTEEEDEQKDLKQHLDFLNSQYNKAHFSDVDTASKSEEESDAPAPPNFQITIHPDMVPVLVSLIKYSRWKTIYYIYNHDEALNRLEGLLNFQMKETDFVTDIIVRKVAHITDCVHVLKSIDKRSDGYNKTGSHSGSSNNPSGSSGKNNEITMMVDLDSNDSYKKFLGYTKSLGMIKIRFHYMLVTLAIHEIDLTEFRQGGLNITGFSLIDYKNVHTMNLFSEALRIDVQPNKSPNISYTAALMADALFLFSQQVNQLLGKDVRRLFGMENVALRNSEIYVAGKRGINCSLTGPNETWPLGDFILNNLVHVPPFEGLTGPISFDEQGRRANYSIGIYRIALNMPLAKIGTFSRGSGLNILEEAIFRERDGFSEINRSRKRIVVSIRDDPFFMLKSNTDPEKNLTGNDRYTGYCVDLAEHLSKIVNFTYEFRLVKDNKFGARDANGNWNGIIGELIRHEADLAISGLTITWDRERAVEFSMPFMNLGISIMIVKPKEDQPKVLSFMAPLSTEIWMCVLLAYVGISVILFLVSRFSPYEWNLEYMLGEQRLHNDFTIFNTMWFCLACFMQQGIDIAPKSISGRLVTSAWWFFTLILISSYTANLAAFLTVERMVSPIESAEDLAKQTEIQYGAVEGGSTKEFFRTSKIKTYQRMWSFMSGFGSSVFVKNNREGVQKVRESKGKYAFLLESSVNEYLNERQPCDTMKVGNNLDSKGYGIATPIGSDLKEAINLAVLQLREDGTLESLKKKWWFDQSECGGNQKSSASSKDASRNSLGLANVAGVFYILIIGLVISVIIAAFEVLYKARTESKRSKAIYKEAVKKPKLRISVDMNEEIIDPDENRQLRSGGPGQTEYGWSLEPLKDTR